MIRNPAQAAAFDALIDATPCLARYRGSVVPRNHCRSESVSSVDISIRQALPFFDWGGSELYINILNFGNLLNDEWGRIDEVPFEYVAEIANFQGVENGVMIYQPTRATFGARQDGVGQSRWQVQVGIKVLF